MTCRYGPSSQPAATCPSLPPKRTAFRVPSPSRRGTNQISRPRRLLRAAGLCSPLLKVHAAMAPLFPQPCLPTAGFSIQLCAGMRAREREGSRDVGPRTGHPVLISGDPEGGMLPILHGREEPRPIRSASHTRMLSAEELAQKRSGCKASSEVLLWHWKSKCVASFLIAFQE